MYTKSILLLFITFQGITAYAPKPEEIRINHFCDENSWKGHCENIPIQYDVCHNFDEKLSKRLSSFRVPNDEQCKLYADRDCPEAGDWVAHRGDQGYLSACGGCFSGKTCWSGCAKHWNDKAVSVKCTWMYPEPY